MSKNQVLLHTALMDAGTVPGMGLCLLFVSRRARHFFCRIDYWVERPRPLPNMARRRNARAELRSTGLLEELAPKEPLRKELSPTPPFERDSPKQHGQAKVTSVGRVPGGTEAEATAAEMERTILLKSAARATFLNPSHRTGPNHWSRIRKPNLTFPLRLGECNA